MQGADEFSAELPRHLPAMKRYARSLCRNETQADDLAQETMARALANRDRFSPGTNMGAWLSTILRNEFLSRARKGGREVGDPEGFMIGNAVSASNTEEAYAAKEALASIETLSPDFQTALLAAGNGQTIAEMADAEGIAEGTAKSRLSRARDALEQAVESGRRPEKTVPVGSKVIAPLSSDHRRIQAIELPSAIVSKLGKVPLVPELREVKPSMLIVEASYQRGLSGKSLALTRKIVAGWDWAKFKPPICAQSKEGLFVIDGQHTAIAAASHPGIDKIPVMVVYRDDVAERAAAFVSQNRDRLALSPLQIFHAELAAGDKAALGILRCVVKAGASVPRSAPAKGIAKPGEIVTVAPLYRIWKARKADHLERVIRIAVLSGKAPINSTILYGLDIALTMEPSYEDLGPIAGIDDAEIAAALAKIDVEKQSAEVATTAGIDRYHGLASLIEQYLWEPGDAHQAVE